MDRTTEASATARNMMVDSQVRPNKVTDSRLIDAMRTLPRERFLPPSMSAVAYVDEDVALGGGRFLMEPMVIARLVQIAAVRSGDRALVVGAGTGYAAVLLDACGAQVLALEEDEALLAIGRPALAAVAPRVALVTGHLADGWAGGAPYDIILIDGAVDEIPPAIAAQIRPAAPTLGGRIVTVLRVGGVCQGGLAEVSAGRVAFHPVFDCATPTLPPLRQPAGFVF